MNLLNVDTISETRDKLQTYCRYISPETETVGLIAAAGKILASDICSSENVPPYKRSTVDGYSVRSADLGAASDMLPTFLNVTGEVLLGRDSSGLSAEPGCCVYTPTGGAVPDGADSVVMVEYCESFGDNMLAVSRPAARGENIVQPGEDIRSGELLLKKGRVLRAQDIGTMAAVGITSVPVYVPWNITIISTGDELVPPDEIPGPGQIRDINSYTIAAQSLREGLCVRRTVAVKDDRDAILNAFEEAKKDSDIIVISGGSSKGKMDMTSDLIEAVADSGVLTHGISAKPGKPTITGFDIESRTMFIGLPGHPAAALMIFEQVLIRIWHDLTGQNEPRTVRARITTNVQSAPGRRTFQLVTLRESEVTEAVPLFAKSGMISPMSRADGYFEMSENQEGVRAGDLVDIRLWK
ncbi:MAG: molybdopterin molybdotransferase MoeA [Lachnospiraceae bacterium]|nr:molybdopterin molybdotransferase MoeA [Lachnospiraceae bacterium]